MTHKICSKCSIEKPVSEFCKQKAASDGLHPHCKTCDRIRLREYYQSSPQRRASVRAINKKAWEKLKHAAIEHYGGYICACCGETEHMFLTLDHIHGGGRQHRKAIGNGHFYRWLRDNEYPDGFQVLCMNCNFGKKMNNGVCPHKESVVWQEK